MKKMFLFEKGVIETYYFYELKKKGKKYSKVFLNQKIVRGFHQLF